MWFYAIHLSVPTRHGDGYEHSSMMKHGAKDWSWYDYWTGATHHTNGVEALWKLFKASMRGTHIHISASTRHLREFAYRSNHRATRNAMFDHL